MGKALERGSDECQSSDNMVMSAMFMMMKTYGHTERCCGKLTSMLCQARDDKRQLQCEHDSEIESLNEELAQMTCQRDQAAQRNEVYEQDIQAIRDQLERLIVGHQNAKHTLVGMM
jgi:septal ring factor EnvC (AmiA/AmiB activator)